MQKIHNLRYYSNEELATRPPKEEELLKRILAELHEAVEAAKKAKGEI
jgi:hypothetical protein